MIRTASRAAIGLFLLTASLGVAGCTTMSASQRSAAVALTAEESRFAADLDRFVTAALARFPTVPAMGVAVSRSRGPIFVKSYGMADRERARAAGPDTLFYIASSTKSFVGLMFARLAAEGRIDLDWTLAELAPDVQFAPDVRAREVTLRHLLSHSHGLVHSGIEYRLAYTGEHDPATLWRLLSSLRANARAPLGTFNYGNLGYNVAALLIERRLGLRWQDLLEREVFRPLGLRHTMAQDIGRPGLPLTAPYAALERLPVVKTDATMQSAGGIYATMDDMARWMTLQLAAERPNGTILAGAIVQRTHRPVATMDERFGAFARRGYGLGWYSGPYREEPLFHSFGSYVGARAHTSFMPSRDIGIAVMSNDEEAGFMLVDVIAAYAYDWFIIGPEGAETVARETLDRLQGEITRHRERMASERARRAARTWQLSQPAAAYRGRYCNDERGTVEVGGSGDTLSIRMGLLRTQAEPYADPDTARVALIPSQGDVMQFRMEGGRPVGLRLGNNDFTRC